MAAPLRRLFMTQEPARQNDDKRKHQPRQPAQIGTKAAALHAI
jgi:hypothetical protein